MVNTEATEKPLLFSGRSLGLQLCARHVIWFLVEIFIGWFWFMHLFVWIFNDSSCMFFKTNEAQAEKTYWTWKSSNLSKTWSRMEIRKLFVHHAQFVLSYEIRIAVEGLRFKFSQKRQYVKTHAKNAFSAELYLPIWQTIQSPYSNGEFSHAWICYWN